MAKYAYENDKISVSWDSNMCIHSTVCIKNLGKVFDTTKKPWVNVDAGSVDEITHLIDSCPSGALSYRIANKNKVESENHPPENEKVKITVSENGPYLITGNFGLEDSVGNTLETRKTLALCRCGSSNNKPFCDGTHRKIEFKG
jgi:uncharacterized Fe-S cluster protein YjdI